MNNYLRQQSIEHYNRMIKWAKKQPQKNECSLKEMKNYFDEAWDSESCAFCNEYLNTDNCPLRKKDSINECYEVGNCCNGLWSKMNESITWKEWIKNAKKVKKYFTFFPFFLIL